jgi:hypothetical protein
VWKIGAKSRSNIARQLVTGLKANAMMVCGECGTKHQQLVEGGELVEQLDNH